MLQEFYSMSGHFGTLCMYYRVQRTLNLLFFVEIFQESPKNDELISIFSVVDFSKIIISWANLSELINTLSANSTKWSNTLKEFAGNSQRIVWVGSTILWG